MSVWTSEASPRQYSADVLIVRIFGSEPRAPRRARGAHPAPVRGPGHQLVNLPRLEAALDRDADGVGESPRGALHLDGHGVPALAHGEARAGVLEVNGRMRDVVAIGERQGRGASVRSPLAAHQP